MVNSGETIEYKYVILNFDAQTRKPRLIRWENFEGNRRIDTSGPTFFFDSSLSISLF